MPHFPLVTKQENGKPKNNNKYMICQICFLKLDIHDNLYHFLAGAAYKIALLLKVERGVKKKSLFNERSLP